MIKFAENYDDQLYIKVTLNSNESYEAIER